MTDITAKSIAEVLGFGIATGGQADSKNVTSVYCCDLLSLAMARAPAGSAWVTVMGNINTIAVASLAEVACVVLADGMAADAQALARAAENGVAILHSPLPVYETAVAIGALL